MTEANTEFQLDGWKKPMLSITSGNITITHHMCFADLNKLLADIFVSMKHIDHWILDYKVLQKDPHNQNCPDNYEMAQDYLKDQQDKSIEEDK